MAQPSRFPSGFLSITLHAHLPYVIHHGTWPHGIEWLHEAAAETYLPLLRVLANLERDGVPACFNLDLSPILLEQLAHPFFVGEFPKYLHRKIVAAREDEAYFTQSGDAHLAETARFWYRFFQVALDDFAALGGDILAGFRRFRDAGMIDILTSAATHSFLPLLGTDESVRAQIRTAVATHAQRLGEPPEGIWIPECGYRPAGFWEYPIPFRAEANDVPVDHAGFQRIGVEQALAESKLSFFFVDTHLVAKSQPAASPYGPAPSAAQTSTPHALDQTLYHPHLVQGPSSHTRATTVFARDPRTGLQVWSGDLGYPGDMNYLDFHKKRFPGGHRYWQVTGHPVDIGDKRPYWPQQAADRTRDHAGHFVQLVQDALSSSLNDATPPILCAPFDAELFGHWWFEGPLWLEAVCRAIHATDLEMIPCSQYLARFPATSSIAMHEGSWGAGGDSQVWFNPETSWTWTHIYPAEIFVRDVCTAGLWRNTDLGQRIAKQLCRELLLLESSDWQFLITTGAARDYAELRFHAHNEQFNDLKGLWHTYAAGSTPTEAQIERLVEIETRDSIFAHIDPAFWSAGTTGTEAG